MSSDSASRSVEERAVGVVRAHPARDALGGLSFDVFSRQAEGRVLFAGREFIEKRAAEHGVTRDGAQTEAGNLLDVLERGPSSAPDRALIVAFAVHGLGVRIRESSPEETSSIIARFVRHVDFFELATPYVVFPWIDLVLPDDLAASVWHEVAQTMTDEDASGIHRARARNAGRLSALAASSSKVAHDELGRAIESPRLDAPSRALALALRGDATSTPRKHVQIRGQLASKRRSPVMRLLRWVSGWALLAWLVRGIGALFGFRHEIEMTIGGKELDVREMRFVLGRKIQESTSTLAIDSIASVRRTARYPALRLSVGVVALSIGLLFGGLVMFDGARSGELSLMLAGAGLALLGTLLDLVIDVVGPGLRARVSLELWARSGRVLRIARIPLDDADRFLEAVRAL